ncbi:RNA polymerase sigma-70 factor [Agromyces sp. ZXT2-3]|uniref:RNA polymerase sigma-70 factor n=1 Tax=Agromyces sp. ZXT2-3 TaxID=3461152 RepID=UPI004054D45F
MRTHAATKVDLSGVRRPRGEWRPAPDLDGAVATFSELRPRLFGIAYRMTGSVADAEDLVQETWLRWQQTDRSVVREPAAFLATTVTRLAINALQSARARREAYVGPWLPEPIDTGANPEVLVEQDESLGFAVLLLLERLTPNERAAYVLREAFAYPYRQIAEIIHATEASARQLVSRARKHLETGRHASVPAPERRRLLEAFLDAAQTGDLTRLEALLTDDIVSYSDGGGLAQAARFPLVGRERVVKFVRAVSEWFWTGIDIRRIEANGEPALLLAANGSPFALFAVDATVDGVDRLFWMVNPGKLGAVLPAGA